MTTMTSEGFLLWNEGVNLLLSFPPWTIYDMTIQSQSAVSPEAFS